MKSLLITILGFTANAAWSQHTPPLEGKDALDAALDRGVIRLATGADLDAWVKAGNGLKRPSIQMGIEGYVILEQFTFPSGLTGAHSVVFFVPRGVPTPRGKPGHSAVFDFASMTCRNVCELAGYSSADRWGSAQASASAVSPSARPPAAPADASGVAISRANAAANYRERSAALNRPCLIRQEAVAGSPSPQSRAALDAALNAALESGQLRLATRADADAWSSATGRECGRPSSLDTYVILGRYHFPQGLRGDVDVAFIVLPGVSKPRGNPGDATIFDYNTGICRGSRC